MGERCGATTEAKEEVREPRLNVFLGNNVYLDFIPDDEYRLRLEEPGKEPVEISLNRKMMVELVKFGRQITEWRMKQMVVQSGLPPALANLVVKAVREQILDEISEESPIE